MDRAASPKEHKLSVASPCLSVAGASPSGFTNNMNSVCGRCFPQLGKGMLGQTKKGAARYAFLHTLAAALVHQKREPGVHSA